MIGLGNEWARKILKNGRRDFLGMPTLGGKLTILNCVLWAAVVLSFDVRRVPIPVLFLLGLPADLLCCCGFDPLRRDVHGLITSVIEPAVLTGVNSIAWGYGLSWAWSRFREGREARRAARRREAGLCVACGYDLRGSGVRCPECGALN